MPFLRFFDSFLVWCRTHRPLAVAETHLRRHGWLVVLIFAFGYYAQYYRSGLNLGGEGGTVAVVAMRLIDGWVPLKDTFLGYNLMWFYPVVWLFQVFGPSYIALRIFFFALCALTGVMAFFVVRRVTGCGWYATVTALLPVLIPGMLFRNYMGFLTVLNMLVFLQAFVYPQRTRVRQLVAFFCAGLALGLTFLVRIDLGVFFLLLSLGLIVLMPVVREGRFSRRVGTALLALVLVVAGLLAAHTPVYLDARRRGFDEQFLAQYSGWVGLIRSLLAEKIGFDPLAAPPSSRPVYTPSRIQLIGLWLASRDTGEAAPVRDLGQDKYRPKPTLDDLAEEETLTEKVFVVATYLPVVVAAAIVGLAVVLFGLSFWIRDPAQRQASLAVLTATGSALTLLPQFFFFRPDTPHLSEFMVPFLIAMACAAWVVMKASLRVRRAWPVGLAFAVLCVFCAGVYVTHAYPKESAGTIAAARKRNRPMTGANGVRVWLKKGEREEVQQLTDLILERTRPGDYVACYPYQPTVNFMTDRPAFEYNLYIDNAHNVANFHAETVAKFEKFRPAAIVIDNRPVNQTDESRFHNWAAETCAWIQANYTYAGTFRRQEVYFRPDLVPPDAPKLTPP